MRKSYVISEKAKEQRRKGRRGGCETKFFQLSGRVCQNCSAGFQPAVSQISNLQYVVANVALKIIPRLPLFRTPFRSTPGRMQFGDTEG
jgi:hypothetical protein